MEFSEFIRQPFKVTAVQITDENIEEICKLIGTEILTQEETGDRYIAIDRRKVPLGTKAFVGSWVTKMGSKLRCYPANIFNDQFLPMTPAWDGWFTKDGEEPGDVAETLEILSDPETMAAIAVVYAEADMETTEEGQPNGPIYSDSTIEDVGSLEVDGEADMPSTKPGPQIGDTYTEDVVEPYAP